MNFLKLIILTTLTLLALAPQIHGASNMAQQEQDVHSKSMSTHQDKDIFLEKREIDEYTVHFHVMKVSPDVELEGSHNFMVKVENQREILGDVIVNSKIIYPSGKSDSKFLAKMGDWYMKDYTLDETGKYQLIILFKTADGKKHKGGVYYEHSINHEQK